MDDKFDPKALWSISYGLYVITSISDDKQNGQIANTVFQVSADPPRIAVSINKDNLTHEYISKSGVFAVSVLDESTPMPFIGLFGFKTGKDVNKLSQVQYKKGVTGAPIVTDNAISVLEAKVIGKADAATHTIFIADVVTAEVLRKGKPLTYATYQEIKKGKAPKNAPTYKGPQAEEEHVKAEEKKEGKMQKYVCGICGYVYDPAEGDSEGNIPAGTSFEALPDDWVCPVCGAGKDEFSPEK